MDKELAFKKAFLDLEAIASQLRELTRREAVLEKEVEEAGLLLASTRQEKQNLTLKSEAVLSSLLSELATARHAGLLTAQSQEHLEGSLPSKDGSDAHLLSMQDDKLMLSLKDRKNIIVVKEPLHPMQGASPLSESLILGHFSQFGQVERVSIHVRNNFQCKSDPSVKPLRIGYVVMSSAEGAEQALQHGLDFSAL